MWFKKLLGFKEINPDQVRSNLRIEGENLLSLVNGKSYQWGTLEIPKLEELRDNSPNLNNYRGKINIQEIVGDVQELHLKNENSVFQAASQFNLLEMANPEITPEQGVDIYEHDFTQGPVCAITCGAGTIYRNYFVELHGQTGQSAKNQIDCLEALGLYFKNDDFPCWQMQNGYVLCNEEGLEHINNIISQLDHEAYETLKGELKIGVQRDTEITIDTRQRTVTQAYCSALPIGYSQLAVEKWEPFARLILEATYEATFYAALRNFESTGNNRLFLTLVGGGVFRNPSNWIFDAIEKAVLKFKTIPLDVSVVSYGASNPQLISFLTEMNKKL